MGLHVGWGIHAWHEREEFDTLRDFGLMSQQFDLRHLHRALELHDYVLWVDAEPLAVPASEQVRVSGTGCQLRDRVLGVLARAVEYLEGHEGLWLRRLLVLRWLVVAIHSDLLCHHDHFL